MSFGIQIINNNDNIIIDENYANTQPLNDTAYIIPKDTFFPNLTATTGGFATIAGQATVDTSSDLAFAQPVRVAQAQLGIGIRSSTIVGFPPQWLGDGDIAGVGAPAGKAPVAVPANGYRTHFLSATANSSASIGFGLQVFKADGSCAYNSNDSEVVFTIVATGQIDTFASPFNFNIPTGRSINDYYVLVKSTNGLRGSSLFGLGYNFYNYDYTNNRIQVYCSYFAHKYIIARKIS
jgi:hypothetical protein